LWQYILTPPTLVNNTPFYAKSTGHVTRPCQGISLPKSKYPGYEVVCLPAYPIFCCLLYDATWCQKYCLLPTVIALWNVQMLGQCQLITAIADQWQTKNIWRKFVFFGPTYPTFFQDIKPEPHIFCNVLWTSEKCRPIDLSPFKWNFDLD
jgi:hypothetical protein